MHAKIPAILAAVLLTMSVRVNAQGVLHDAPGTPVSGFSNTGGQRVVIDEGGGVGVQPITAPASATAFNTFAGDVVFLQDPAAGDAPSNWAAVLQFFNPADPSGILDLEGTRYETFQSNNTPGGFASFTLLPNTIYLPTDSVAQDGTRTASYSEFGPDGQILAGQLAIFVLTAAPQPDAVPEPGTLGCLGAGALLLGIILRQRKGLRCPVPALPVD